MDLGVHQIEKHYIDEHQGQIFCTKLCVNGKCFNILYDYEKKDEILISKDVEIEDCRDKSFEKMEDVIKKINDKFLSLEKNNE